MFLTFKTPSYMEFFCSLWERFINSQNSSYFLPIFFFISFFQRIFSCCTLQPVSLVNRESRRLKKFLLEKEETFTTYSRSSNGIAMSGTIFFCKFPWKIFIWMTMSVCINIWRENDYQALKFKCHRSEIQEES